VRRFNRARRTHLEAHALDGATHIELTEYDFDEASRTSFLTRSSVAAACSPHTDARVAERDVRCLVVGDAAGG
jgi:hypothetical protein